MDRLNLNFNLTYFFTAPEESYWDSAGSTDSPINYGQNSSPMTGHTGASSSPYSSYQYATQYCTQEEYDRNNGMHN